MNGYASVKCVDPEKAVFNVANCLEAIRTFAQSSVRTAVGKMELQEILDNRSLVSGKVQEDIRDDIAEWGFNITRFEISDLSARDRRVQEALKKQITAEQESKEKKINADSYVLQTKNKTDALYFQLTKDADG